MLSLDHKATLLRKAGFPVPAAPRDCTPQSAEGNDDERSGPLQPGASGTACARWRQDVDDLFVAHSIARAMRSLQQGELRLRDALAHYLPARDRPDVSGTADR